MNRSAACARTRQRPVERLWCSFHRSVRPHLYGRCCSCCSGCFIFAAESAAEWRHRHHLHHSRGIQSTSNVVWNEHGWILSTLLMSARTILPFNRRPVIIRWRMANECFHRIHNVYRGAGRCVYLQKLYRIPTVLLLQYILWSTPCLKKTVPNFFWHNLVKFSPTLIIFGSLTAQKKISLCDVHLFSTPPN